MNWYIKAMKNYFNIRGRAQRSEFWYFTLFYMIGSAALTYADISLGLVDKENKIGLLSLVFALIHFVPSITLAIRRFHDIGRRGWWMLIVLVPILGFIAYLILMAQNSDGDNQFGDSPKGYDEEKKGSIFMALLSALLAVALLMGAAYYKFGPMMKQMVMEKYSTMNGGHGENNSLDMKKNSFDFSLSTAGVVGDKSIEKAAVKKIHKEPKKEVKTNTMDEELRAAQAKIDEEFKESQKKIEQETALKEKGLSPLDFDIAREKAEAKKRLDSEYKKAMMEMN